MSRWLERNFKSAWIVFAIATVSLLAQAARQLASIPTAPQSRVAGAFAEPPGRGVEALAPIAAASIILGRNPFDSTTRATTRERDEGAGLEPREPSDPLEASADPVLDRCPGDARLTLSLLDPAHPDRALAVLSFGAARGGTRTVHVGSVVGAKTVVAVTARRVFFVEDARYCFVDMAPAPPPDSTGRAGATRETREMRDLRARLREGHS